MIVCVCFFSQFLYRWLEVSVGGKKFQWFPKFILPLAELVKTTRKKTNVVHWSAEMYFDMGTATTECFVLVEVAANGIKPGHSWWKKRWLVQKNQINLKSALNWSFLHWVEKVWCTERRKRSTQERKINTASSTPKGIPSPACAGGAGAALGVSQRHCEKLKARFAAWEPRLEPSRSSGEKHREPRAGNP